MPLIDNYRGKTKSSPPFHTTFSTVYLPAGGAQEGSSFSSSLQTSSFPEVSRNAHFQGMMETCQICVICTQECLRCLEHFGSSLLALSSCLPAGSFTTKKATGGIFLCFPSWVYILRFCHSHPMCLDEFPGTGNFVIAFNMDSNTFSNFIEICCFLAEVGCYYQVIHKQQRNQFM